MSVFDPVLTDREEIPAVPRRFQTKRSFVSSMILKGWTQEDAVAAYDRWDEARGPAPEYAMGLMPVV